MIIFDELAFAKKIEQENIVNSHNILKKGVLLSKLYFSQGLNESEVRLKLENKFSILDGSYNYNIKYIKISKMIEQAKQFPELVSKNISFSKQELDFVRKFNNIDIEKIYFILLCVSKFYNNKFYFSNREIFELAQIKWSGVKSKEIFCYLVQNGYLLVEERGLVNNRKIRKLFYSIPENILSLYDKDNIIMVIENYKNIIYYYLEHFNIGEYIRCEKCGCIELQTTKGRKRYKYCIECAKIKHDLEKGRYRKMAVCGINSPKIKVVKK